MLLLFKPFQVGDYIIVNGQDGSEGTVSKIEICYTTPVVHRQQAHRDPQRCSFQYDHHQRDSKRPAKTGDQGRNFLQCRYPENRPEILEDILTDDPDTREDEEMVVFVDELAESSVIMGFRVWADTDRYWDTRWRLNQRIKEDFDYYGIEIPYNQLDVHLHK